MNNSKLLKVTMAVIILFEIVVFVLYYFLFTDIKRKNENISVLKSDLLLQTEKQKYMVSMQNMVKNTDSDITLINNSIIQKNEDIKFIENIERIARNNGVEIKIDSLSFKDNISIKSSGLTMLNARVTIDGSWAGIYSFLFELESSPFKIKIDKFSSVHGDTEVADKWQGVFEIGVLKYK